MTPDEIAELELERDRMEIDAYEREHMDPARDDALCETHLKMAAEYAGQWVIYADHWDGNKLDPRVLATGPDLRPLLALAETWPEEVQDVATAEYFDPPQEPPAEIRLRSQVPESA